MTTEQLTKDCPTCDGAGTITREYTDSEFEEYLDEIYGDVNICGIAYSSGRALKEIDPIAFNCAMSEHEELDECPDCDGRGEVEQ